MIPTYHKLLKIQLNGCHNLLMKLFQKASVLDLLEYYSNFLRILLMHYDSMPYNNLDDNESQSSAVNMFKIPPTYRNRVLNSSN